MRKHEDLKNMMIYAYQETAYYKKLFDEYGIIPSSIEKKDDLHTLPVLTAAGVQENEAILVAKDYQKFPKINMIDIGRVIRNDGLLIKIYSCRNGTDAGIASAWTRRNEYGITKESKRCYFYGVNYAGNKLFTQVSSIISPDKSELSFRISGLTEKKWLEVYDQILHFEPEWLILELDEAEVLTDLIEDKNLAIPKNLKLIELHSTSQIVKERLERVFNAQVVPTLWTAEAGIVAYMCKYGNLHILEENAVVETVVDSHLVSASEGMLCLTTLQNYAMPLIRYDTGIKGAIGKTQCSCGHNSATFKIAPRQESNVFVLSNGEKITRRALNGIAEITNENMQGCISQFLVQQLGGDTFCANMTMKPKYHGWGNAVKDEFLKTARDMEKLGIQWRINIT